jgi:hypothetical protein
VSDLSDLRDEISAIRSWQVHVNRDGKYLPGDAVMLADVLAIIDRHEAKSKASDERPARDTLTLLALALHQRAAEIFEETGNGSSIARAVDIVADEIDALTAAIKEQKHA